MNDTIGPANRRFAAFPEHWKRISSRGFAWFTTHVVYALPDGRVYHWESRRHRKGRGGVVKAAEQEAPARLGRNFHWWGYDFSSLAWWIAFIFTIGSVFLVIGALGPFMPNRVVHAVTFSFLGSTCFTVANYLSLLEIINADRRTNQQVQYLESEHRARKLTEDASVPTLQPVPFRWWAWMPQELAFIATFIMFAGGLLFKLCFVFGVLKWLTWVEVDILINLPGLLGAVCFVAGSYLYIVEVVHKPWGIQLRNIAWWSAFTCLLGSVGYTISAVYGFFGEGPIVIEQAWGNYAAVLVGAVFFFISSRLMIPEALDRPAEGRM